MFISYTVRDADGSGRTAALALEAALTVNGFQPIRDEEVLEGGDDWHDDLNDHLWECDAAVIVLSPGIKRSDWVQYEVDVLASRHGRCNDFPLVPLYVGTMSHQGLPDGPGFGTLQRQTSAQSPVAAAELLAKTHIVRDDPEVRLELILMDILSSRVSPGLLRHVGATELKIPVFPWKGQKRATEAIARVVATTLLTADLPTAAKALKSLAGALRDRLHEALQIVAASWLPPAGVRGFRLIPFATPPLGAVAFVPVSDAEVAGDVAGHAVWTLAARGAGKVPAWVVVALTNTTGGDDQPAALLRELRASLMTRPGLDNEAKLKRWSGRKPLDPWIVFVPGVVSREALEALRAAYPHLAVVHCGPDGVVDKEQLPHPGTTLVVPLLDFAQALTAWDDYQQADIELSTALEQM